MSDCCIVCASWRVHANCCIFADAFLVNRPLLDSEEVRCLCFHARMARVCVIGAGASCVSLPDPRRWRDLLSRRGIAAIHELLNFSFDIVCYELRKEAGGAWLYDADPGDSRLAFDHHGHPVVSSSVERDAGYSPSPMYNGLRTNIPCEGMAYRRKPFPKGTARFPTQKVVLDYLQARARQVDRYIQYGVKVTRVCKEEGAKKWTVETRSMSGNEVKSEEFDHVLVANGHCAFQVVLSIR